jgi:hypothetical protein
MQSRLHVHLILLLTLALLTACGRGEEEAPIGSVENVQTQSEPSLQSTATGEQTGSEEGAPADDATPETTDGAQAEGPVSIVAEAREDDVTVIVEENPVPLPAPEATSLNTGDGVTVSQEGRAFLRLHNLLLLEITRDGEIKIDEASPQDVPIILRLRQTFGTLFNNFTIDQEWKDWVAREGEQVTILVETSLATNRIQWSVRDVRNRHDVGAAGGIRGLAAPAIQATGTSTTTEGAAETVDGVAGDLVDQGWTISLESDTQLGWAMVSDEAVSLTVESAVSGVTVENNMAHWVAPDGEIGSAVPYKREAVAAWFEKIFAGEETFEIGDVLWDPADVVATTADLASPTDANQAEPAFMLGGVEVMLQSADYTLSDCNDDGIDDIFMADGTVLFNFRPLLNRVRSVDVQLFNVRGTRDIRPLNPAREIIEQDAGVLTKGEHELLSVRSNPSQSEEPYHFLELEMENGCFLGFSLTPPLENLEPAPPRWPLDPDEQAVFATDTPTPTPSPTATPCVVAACPDGWASYLVRSGDTLWELYDRTQYFAPGLTMDQIREANCMAPDSDMLPMGAVVCVPAPPTPTPTSTPTPTPTPTPDECPPLSVAVEEYDDDYEGGAGAVQEQAGDDAANRADEGDQDSSTSPLPPPVEKWIRLSLTVSGGCPPYILRVPGQDRELFPAPTVSETETVYEPFPIRVCNVPSPQVFTVIDSEENEKSAIYTLNCESE